MTRRVCRPSTLLTTVIVASLVVGSDGLAQSTYPGERWDSLPAGARWSPDTLRAIGATVTALGSGAVVVIDDGRLVAQWGEPARRFPMTSVRKSLVSALIGIAVGRGQISPEATLAAIGIDDEPRLTSEEKTARVIDLLGSRSGVYHPAAYEPASMRKSRPVRGSARAGERWFYNNWDFNTLGTIYERATGRSVFDAFATEIAEPIGMEDYRVSDGQHVRDSTSLHAAYTFRVSARDLARYMLLWSNDGRWRDRQLIPQQWVRASTRPISDAGKDGSYGLLWWVERDGRLVPGTTVEPGSFAARGNGPHYAVVIPSRRLIIIHLANTDTPSPANWVERTDVGALFERIRN